MTKIKRRVHHVLEAGKNDDFLSWFIEIFLIVLIVINVVSLILETVRSVNEQFSHVFYYIDIVSVTIFTVVYVLRVWSITASEKYSHPVRGRLKYMLSPVALCDLLSLIPFYLPFVQADLRSLRLLRFLRLLRVFKITRYFKALTTINRVLVKKRHELAVSLIMILLVLVVMSTIMFYVENEVQPDKFSSIPATMWWGIITITTVGYGDAYPITSFGKVLGGVITIVGVGLFAVPTAILASGFSENFIRKKKSIVCPHCHQEIEDPHLHH